MFQFQEKNFFGQNNPHKRKGKEPSSEQPSESDTHS